MDKYKIVRQQNIKEHGKPIKSLKITIYFLLKVLVQNSRDFTDFIHYS